MRPHPALLASLCAALLCAAAPSAAAAQGPFLDVGFQDALARAGAEDKLLLLAFYDEHCESCDTMDELTLGESRVRAWMAENMLAVRIDADEAELAARYAVDLRPTFFMVDAEGTALERFEGFRKPLAFLRVATVAREGSGLLAVERAYKDSPEDLELRLRYGRMLVRRQRQLEGLEHILFVFDHTRGDPAWAERRLDEVLREVAGIQRTFSEAAKELSVRRDRAAAMLLEGYDPETPEAELREAAAELAALNRNISQTSHTVFAWNVLRKREDFPAAVTAELFTSAVEIELMNEQRYTELLEVWGDPIVAVDLRLAQFQEARARAAAHPEEKINLTRELNSLLADARKYYEALIGSGRDAEAGDLEAMLRALANEGQTYITLVTAAYKAGRADRAEVLIEAAKESVPAGKDRERMLQVFVRLGNQEQRKRDREESARKARELGGSGGF